jgi:hypothetical protein
MDIERYNYICSLIIDCAAYAIGGPAIHERIISQNLPELQQHYPEQAWTLDRVRRLFEANGLLDAITVSRVNISTKSARSAATCLYGKNDQQTRQEQLHANQIQLHLARIGHILKKLKADASCQTPSSSAAPAKPHHTP